MGTERTVTGKTLQTLLNASEREIKNDIQRLRFAGVPIGASKTNPAGYYIITNPAEQKRYSSAIENQALTSLRVATAIKNADLLNWKDQILNQRSNYVKETLNQ